MKKYNKNHIGTTGLYNDNFQMVEKINPTTKLSSFK